MRQTVRYYTFETNSSSTHSCVITSEEERAKWKTGDLLAGTYSSNLITKEEAEKEYKEANYDGTFEDWLNCEGYYNYEQWCNYQTDDCYLEVDTETKEVNGVKIYVDCAYGNN